jgi:hypothetical protein
MSGIEKYFAYDDAATHGYDYLTELYIYAYDAKGNMPESYDDAERNNDYIAEADAALAKAFPSSARCQKKSAGFLLRTSVTRARRRN